MKLLVRTLSSAFFFFPMMYVGWYCSDRQLYGHPYKRLCGSRVSWACSAQWEITDYSWLTNRYLCEGQTLLSSLLFQDVEQKTAFCTDIIIISWAAGVLFITTIFLDSNNVFTSLQCFFYFPAGWFLFHFILSDFNLKYKHLITFSILQLKSGLSLDSESTSS